MTGETDGSAEAFDPVAFAERWYEHVWPIKRPNELRRYIEALERQEGKHEDP